MTQDLRKQMVDNNKVLTKTASEYITDVMKKMQLNMKTYHKAVQKHNEQEASWSRNALGWNALNAREIFEAQELSEDEVWNLLGALRLA